MALPIFTITIFVSAFLLFLVQPLVGKLILPKLGGTPQVWNTCMVFFQSALLLGYAYTHSVSTRLKLRQQLMVHGALLAIPIVAMLLFPIYSTVQDWPSLTEGTPIVNTFILLFTIVGIPFFVVSTSAPLLQKWFGYSGHSTAKDPYFLYSASNAGSLLSLFFYPAVIEPNTYLQTQSLIWFIGYAALAGLIVYCIITIYKLAPSDEKIAELEAAGNVPPPPPMEAPEAPAPVPDTSTAVKPGHAPGSPGMKKKAGKLPAGKLEEEPEAAPSIAYGALAPMSNWRRVRWVLLAAIPSSLMLGVTSYISTDLSPFPLVWIIPLALYLLSFILVFMKGWTQLTPAGTSVGRWDVLHILFRMISSYGYTPQQATVYVLQPIGLIMLCYIILVGGFDVYVATSAVMLGFFFNALGCHGELAQDRPDTKHLTEFFLLMSVGGMVGGVFNGIIAPIVFQRGVVEYYIAIIVACMIRPQYIPSGWFDELILNAFPGFQGWVRNQGDEMAKSMGRPAPRSTYLFSFFLDIVLALFILAISYYLRGKYYDREWLAKLIQFLKAPGSWAEPMLKICIFAPPLAFIFFFAGRPLRMGLSVFGLLFASLYLYERDENILEARRTYFGVLRVMTGTETPRDPDEAKNFTKARIVQDGKSYTPFYEFTYLMHGTTYHGRNYKYDPSNKHIVDLSRLATTYYHRYGPVGGVMERYNWFPGPQNTYWGDARLPASLVGSVALDALSGSFPMASIVQTYSEPPFATIGLGTGTMASYARPYQHLAYYEIDEVIRSFSLPDEDRDARFTYLQGSIRRGTNLEVVMGDARLSMEPKRESKNIKNTLTYAADFSKVKKEKAPRPYADAPYALQGVKEEDGVKVAEKKSELFYSRDKYYKVIVVDAFSSDAIPIHLVTKQAIKIYLDKLTDDGVLCVHTSNRHMDLVRPVARIAMELNDAKDASGNRLYESGVYCTVGKDRIDRREREWFMGHFSSEYVMIYKDPSITAYLKGLYEDHEKLFSKWAEEAKEESKDERYFRAPADRPILYSKVEWYDPYANQSYQAPNGRTYTWHQAVTKNDSLWTDDYSYILGVLR